MGTSVEGDSSSNRLCHESLPSPLGRTDRVSWTAAIIESVSTRCRSYSSAIARRCHDVPILLRHHVTGEVFLVQPARRRSRIGAGSALPGVTAPRLRPNAAGRVRR